MERRDNYAIQTRQAQDRFLSYDQRALIEKLGLEYDEYYFYVNLLWKPYRLSRATGDLWRQEETGWAEANTFHEVLTLLDLICDSREDRHLAGRWKSMESFGLMFHQNLLQEQADPVAQRIDWDPEGFRRACMALGGQAVAGADMAYAIELFDGLKILMQFWHGDEEFAPRLRWFWDENALQYIRYETMYYAIGLVKMRLLEQMDS